MDTFDPTYSVYLPSGGHLWVVEAGKPADDATSYQLLPVQVPADSGLLVQKFSPFVDRPCLFRTFAAVSPDCEGVRAFADTYGRLHDSPTFLDGRGGAKTFKRKGAETLKEWQQEIRAMRAALELWEMIRARD